MAHSEAHEAAHKVGNSDVTAGILPDLNRGLCWIGTDFSGNYFELMAVEMMPK